MLDFDAGKLLIIGVVALVVIGPKELPRVLRQVGQMVGRVRRMAAEFQGQFMDAMKEADIQSIRDDLKKIGDEADAQIKVNFDPARDIQRELTSSLEAPAAAQSIPALAEIPHAATDGFALPSPSIPDLASEGIAPAQPQAAVEAMDGIAPTQPEASVEPSEGVVPAQASAEAIEAVRRGVLEAASTLAAPILVEPAAADAAIATNGAATDLARAGKRKIIVAKRPPLRNRTHAVGDRTMVTRLRSPRPRVQEAAER